MHLLFVTPALAGPATGGTLYNRQLLAALPAALSFEQHSVQTLPGDAHAEQVWVDSLYLAELPELRRRFAPETRVGLLLHYLPSLLSNPHLHTLAELNEPERRALEHADMIITSSEFLRQLVLTLCPGKACACVMPGVALQALGGSSQREPTVFMSCNVTEHKGVLPFLAELAELVQPSTHFALSIAGSLQLHPPYAWRCLELCQQDAWLRVHASFLGSLPQPELFERLGRASVFVSASHMESYGMALAEARALGTPILALAGGNVANHVAADSGGELAHSPRELAHLLCKLMAEPSELAARLARARAAACARAWRDAARDFVAAVGA
jgi:glycosyltransferase involved in cell wall biosynthesis